MHSGCSENATAEDSLRALACRADSFPDKYWLSPDNQLSVIGLSSIPVNWAWTLYDGDIDLSGEFVRFSTFYF